MQNLIQQRTGRAIFCLALSVLLCVSCLFVSPGQAYGVTSAEKQAEADEIMQSIDSLQTQINEANAEYERATGEYEAASAAADEAAARVEAANVRIAELQATLSERASSMYKTGGQISFIDVLFEATSFEEFLTMWDMFDKISEQDAAMIQETKDVRIEAEEAQAEYEKQMEIAAQEMENIRIAKEEIEASKAEMEITLERVNEEIVMLQAKEEEERLAAEEAKRRAEEAAAAAAASIAASNQSSGSTAVDYGSGEVASGWTHPCPGATMSNPFGWAGAWDGAYHNGVDYAAPTGTPILAACAGTVSYVGGYGTGGNAVIVNHGNGVRSIYMHMSGFATTAGVTVAAGDVIGYVGTTGYSTGPHLHFQVDVNGTPVDGRAYIGY